MEKGRKTNITGTQLEKAVQAALLAKVFEIVMYRIWTKNPEDYGKELLLKNPATKNLYTGENNKDKRILVFSLSEFFIWANNTFES